MYAIFAIGMRWPGIIFILLLMLSACSPDSRMADRTGSDFASFFSIIRDSLDSHKSQVVVISPYDGRSDTLTVICPMDNIVCMSSSNVAALSAIGAGDAVSAVSGLRYITDKGLHERAVPDIGYESSLDYETILRLNPDVVVTYTVSGAEPQYITKLRSLGVNVLVLHDHLEEHPLARAEYVRLFGALTGRLDLADSLFQKVCDRYDGLASSVRITAPVKVLMNIPYGDAWYIPGADSYMSRLINDAGGSVLGAEKNTAKSKVITLEQAYDLSMEADMWLNPGHCRSVNDLVAFHHFFERFGPVSKGLPIYNNTLRTTPEGGNDFWESGAVRPDIILEDLISVFSGSPSDSLHYFLRLDQ